MISVRTPDDSAAPAGLQSPWPKLVLASGSATRLALLRAAGLVVDAQPAAVDEASLKLSAQADGMSADDAALLLAEHKAMRVGDPDALVVGADQILVCDGAWFDKPADVPEARLHLQALRGRTHVLQTAVVCRRQGRTIWRHVAAPRLRMRAFSDAFLDAYLALEGTAVLASVGCYRLEGPGIQLFEAIEGEHEAVLGLPMLALLGFLRQHGLLRD